MNGISSIVALLLIVVIVVSVSVAFWSFISGYFSNLTTAGENSTQAAMQTVSSCIRIEESFKNSMFIRNCGKGVINEASLSVYVDNSPVGFVQSPSVINEGKSGNVTISSSVAAGQHTIRIFSSSAQATIQFTSDGSGNFRII
jgi:hypothetical protein